MAIFDGISEKIPEKIKCPESLNDGSDNAQTILATKNAVDNGVCMLLKYLIDQTSPGNAFDFNIETGKASDRILQRRKIMALMTCVGCLHCPTGKLIRDRIREA